VAACRGPLLALTGTLLNVSIALAAEPELVMRIAGEEAVVFRSAADGCEKNDIPDAPARAFRDASGRGHLFASHFVNRGLVGPDLEHLRIDCRVVYRGAERDDPAAFDDRSWLGAFHTRDGTTVAALVHNEFQGNRRPALCPSSRYIECWYNSV